MATVTRPRFDAVYGVEEAEICNKALMRLSADIIKDTDEDTKQSRACRVVYSQTRDELLRSYPFNFAMKTAYVPQDVAFAQPMDEYEYAFNAEDHQSFTGTTTTAGATITAITGITVTSRLIGRHVIGSQVPADTRIISVVDTIGAESITLDRPVTLGSVGASLQIRIPMLKLLEIAHNDTNIFEVIGGGANRRILCSMYSPESGATVPPYDLEIKYVEQVIDPSTFDSMFIDALALRIASKMAVTLTTNAQLATLMQQEFAAIMQLAQNSSSQERQVDAQEPFWTDRQDIVPVSTRR